MASARVLILRAPGTNCDQETAFAFQQAGAQTTSLHVKSLCQSPAKLQEFSILAFPGGFSYGDDLGSGVILANEITQTLYEPFKRFIERGGLVLGICNGFQVLVKTGFLPGSSYAPKSPDQPPAATLTFNDSQRFEDRWVTLRVEPSQSPFLEGEAGRVLTFPVAHGEGKFVARDAETLQKIEEGKQVAFRYVSSAGSPPAYPENPNGAQNDIAGITDETGRVLGLMPHP
ncbi:MAG TPA: phosphoribosylformylglycinamidine synthase I, partial [Planctomycetota bacterium]|nr:phosphoribosylformylglycinamidine synthase I [Planctomycetota bacterium]